jgi:hypothetical protein
MTDEWEKRGAGYIRDEEAIKRFPTGNQEMERRAARAIRH